MYLSALFGELHFLVVVFNACHLADDQVQVGHTEGRADAQGACENSQ